MAVKTVNLNDSEEIEQVILQIDSFLKTAVGEAR